MAQTVIDAITNKFGDALTASTSSADTQHGENVVYVVRDKLVELATFLRDDDAMAFDSPVFVTCIDRMGSHPESDNRFHVCYQLRSLKHRHCIRVKIELTEDDPKLPSLAALWPAFDWQERETFDMYGIQFDGHHDLRRIYMYEEFVGYPLRKDYPKEKRQPLVRRHGDLKTVDPKS